jgi:hypothetical protein
MWRGGLNARTFGGHTFIINAGILVEIGARFVDTTRAFWPGLETSLHERTQVAKTEMFLIRISSTLRLTKHSACYVFKL